MNILYIEHYAGSPEMGMEFRPYYLSREWVKMGHKVTIIAGDYSHLRKKNPENIDGDFKKEMIDGIEYRWVRTGAYSGNGVKRALTMERFVRKLMLNAKRIARKWNPDVVIASSTYPLDTYPAQKIAKLSGAKYIHEVHDMWPSTLYEVGGMSKHSPFVVTMQIAENSAYKHCDKCVSLLKYSKDYMLQHYLEENKFIYIPNGVVKEEWDNPLPLPYEYLSVFENNKDKFIVGYFGGHALSNCLNTLIEAAEIMKEEQVQFVLVGDGVEKKNLEKYVTDKKLKNVTFLPPIEKRVIPKLTEYFDCVYVGAKKSPLYRFGVCPNKMFDGMMAAKPVCGIVVKSENPKLLKDAIISLINTPKKEREQMGDRGKQEVLNKYIYEKLANDFVVLMY